LAPRRYPENPDGNGVWPGEVLHGDHQLMRPARCAAPPIFKFESGDDGIPREDWVMLITIQ
jgi:hypothetical protein